MSLPGSLGRSKDQALIFQCAMKTTIPEEGIMDLLKSIIARDVDGDLVDKDRNKVLKTDRKAEPKAKAAPRPAMGKF